MIYIEEVSIMAVPKQRHTKSRRNKRRANIFLEAPVLAICSKCQKQVLPHVVCSNCGYYKGQEVVDVLKKLTKKERKEKEKELVAKKAEKDEAGNKSVSWEGLSKK